MQTLLFVLGGVALAVCAVGLFAILISARRAPVGFEDHDGFHSAEAGRSRNVELAADPQLIPDL